MAQRMKLQTFRGVRKFKNGLQWLELLAASEIHSLSAIVTVGAMVEGGSGRPFEFSFNPRGWEENGGKKVWAAETDINPVDPDSKQVAGWGKTPAKALAHCLDELHEVIAAKLREQASTTTAES